MKIMSPSSVQNQSLPTPRRIPGFNRIGVYTLMEREIMRFLTVWLQTILAPLVTTLLFYAIFALAFGGNARMAGDVPFMVFLAPGLIMMTMVQNAFANTSSSIMISKLQGNIVDLIMPPLSAFEQFLGYAAGGLARGMLVGVTTGLAVACFVPLDIHSWGIIVLYALLGNMMLGTLGIAAAIWSERFDHIAAVTNFLVTPMTFLSGTFYSINSLPEKWHALALYNPFFYMIDGFRSGFTGHADGHIVLGLEILTGVNILLALLVLWMFHSGYKLKS